MTSFLQKLLHIIFLLIVFAACNDPNKNGKQNKADEIKDTLSTNNTFLFLTEWFNKVGVYKYDLVKKKYSTVWWHPRENVVMLIYKPDNLPAYFLTSDKIESEGSFPSFSGLKLFIICNDFSETKQIDNIGDGIQFTANWNEDENLELIYTSVDKTIANYVNQYTKVYDHYGKLIDSDTKTFDILKNGFPELVPPRNSTVSPSGKYGVSIKNDSLFLKTTDSDSLLFISILKHKLNKLKWSDDEKYFFLSTLDLDNETIKTVDPETSELFIYSLSADSLIVVFGGSGVKNFFSMRDLLIFDDGFDNQSIINIYDLKSKKIADVIRSANGCGLQIMPTLSVR